MKATKPNSQYGATGSANPEWCDLPCQGDNPLRLAMIAAPFAAAGMDLKKACEHAFSLLIEADRMLSDIAITEAEEKNSSLKITADEAMTDLGVKRARTLRAYVFKLLPTQEALQLWKRACAGDRVFTLTNMKLIRDHRQNIANARQARATEAKRRKLGA